MSLTQYLVVGANRGLGLEFVRQLLQKPENRVIATYRDASKLDELNKLSSERSNAGRLDSVHKLDELNKLSSERSNAGRLDSVQLDMNVDESCKAAVNEIRSKAGSIDVLIINAGINNHIDSLLEQSIAEVANTFNNNVLGPLRITQHFASLFNTHQLSKLVFITSAQAEVANTFNNNVLGPLRITQHFASLFNTRQLSKLVFITSAQGSLSRGKNSNTPSYGISKAALNMMGRKLAHELEPSNVAVVLVHPGWVQTDMGGSDAPITPVQSIGGMLKVIEKVDLKNSGEYWQWDGQNLPW
ncbi:unnamed protein product [Rhizoctonia solani]|uniref:C-factor n=1 Tax=Rhizoctonia solani TaxID=456999 RepID=A0A8H3B0D5_9AGAM|nr:unnamed protein product [Rhizoctonia solani]